MKNVRCTSIAAAIAVAVVAGCVAAGCRTAKVSVDAGSLSLIAPSGEVIADGIHALKEETSLVLQANTKAAKKVEIIAVSYLPVPKGYAAIVEYLDPKGINGKYFKANGLSGKIKTKSKQLTTISYAKNQDESTQGEQPLPYLTCIADGACSGCSIEAVYDESDNVVLVTCSCDDCSIKMDYSSIFLKQPQK
ncbi:MAG: hypothetical protein LBK18_10125 [Prevotellaceae bacterium]|jgi:hypothetical protein|nr:hypothetical protein [Prevotellaceae bacterium]